VAPLIASNEGRKYGNIVAMRQKDVGTITMTGESMEQYASGACARTNKRT
jgi:S-adenosylmethionine synthetase